MSMLTKVYQLNHSRKDDLLMEQKIYIGPNVRTLGLLRNQVYVDGLPGQVKVAIQKFPMVEELIVPVEDFNEAETKAHTKGEHLNRVYQEFCAELGKEAE